MANTIKGMDVAFTHHERARVLDLLNEVMRRGWLMYGPAQQELESRFCQMTHRRLAVTFNSNTSAQECLFALLKPRRVGFLGNHYPTPVFAARRQGARACFCDFAPATLSPTAYHLDALPLEPGDVFVVQETAGFLPDWGIIADWASAHGVFVVEDCGQSVGTQDAHGTFAGSFGNLAVFSLAGTKAMTTGGQGGLIVLDDEELARNLFSLKNGGRPQMFTFDFQAEGFNFHLTEIQAAFGLVMLETLVERREARAKVARIYDSMLPKEAVACGSRLGAPNWFKYPILLSEGVAPAAVRAALIERGIELASEVYGRPSYRFDCWGGEFAGVQLPGTERFCSSHVCLPMHNGLTAADAERVMDVLKTILAPLV